MAMPSGLERRGLEQLLSWPGWEAGRGQRSGKLQGEGCQGRAGAARWWDHSLHWLQAPWARRRLAGPSARGIISLKSVSQVLAWEEGRENRGSLIPEVICTVNMNMNVSIILTSGKPENSRLAGCVRLWKNLLVWGSGFVSVRSHCVNLCPCLLWLQAQVLLPLSWFLPSAAWLCVWAGEERTEIYPSASSLATLLLWFSENFHASFQETSQHLSVFSTSCPSSWGTESGMKRGREWIWWEMFFWECFYINCS